MCTSAGRSVPFTGLLSSSCLDYFVLFHVLATHYSQDSCYLNGVGRKGKCFCTSGDKRGNSEDAKVSTVMFNVERRALGRARGRGLSASSLKSINKSEPSALS